jgi:hypothetical protein
MDQSDRSILAEIALELVTQRELVATSGLGSILRKSQTARDRLGSWTDSSGISLPDGLIYRNEQYDEAAPGRPDIVGSVSGNTHLIIEGKFWADLTEHQPADYLRRLVSGGCLLFVVPGKRKELLWSKVKERALGAGFPHRDEVLGQKLFTARMGDDWWMAVVSWTDLLGELKLAMDGATERHLMADVDQLLPLPPRDLSNPTPLRLFQLMNLVEKIKAAGILSNLFQKSRLTRGGTLGQWLQYIRSGNFQLALSTDLKRWNDHGMMPLWLEISVTPGDVLRELEVERPQRIFYDGFKNGPVIGLKMRLYDEESAVIADLLDQIAEILERVKDCPPTVSFSTTDRESEGVYGREVGTELGEPS